MGPSLAWVKDVDGSARAESMAEPGHVDSDEIGLCNHLPRLFFSADDCPTSLHMKWALSLLVRYPNCPDPGLLQVSLAFIRRLASPRGLARLSVFYRGIIDHLWQILPFPPTGQPSSAVLMSASSHINGKPSAANPHLMLEEASKRYERLTGQDLTTHPLSAKLDDWGSVEAVLKVFQEQAQVFNEFHKDHRRLLEWLTPTVRTLITASAILDDSEAVTEGFNQIFFFFEFESITASVRLGLRSDHLFFPYHSDPTLFSAAIPARQRNIRRNKCPPCRRSLPKYLGGVGNTRHFQAAAGVATNYDILARLFERIHFSFQRLNIYPGIRPTPALIELLGSIMAELILILAIATKEMTRRPISE